MNHTVSVAIGVLATVSVILHALLLHRPCLVSNFAVLFSHFTKLHFQIAKKNGSKNLTFTFLLVNSVAQLLHLLLVAPCEMSWLFTRNWHFGSFMCKLFKSWKSVCSGTNPMSWKTPIRKSGLFRYKFNIMSFRREKWSNGSRV